ncbi:ATP-binding protein [Fimbriiglobus ruber]|uniref:histidine kinase n=1 Tax=Fimbriiglobus ruber TaxID=1908690 RepID=A0A225DSA0_9BACT|nr:ATP-binding protein [Fimbriiglobus ruber]OWK43943.1 Chemotaxis protein methyltransferase CheR [Fimbriiglobus ruber]
MARPTSADLPNTNLLLAYVADLELEVDRLRKQADYLRHEARDTVRRVLSLCAAPNAGAVPPALAEFEATARHLGAVVRDLHDPPGYHPAHDQVIAIAVRPLAEQVFRWQQRLTGRAEVTLRLGLEADHVEWFPARLRHILDNLFSNAFRYRDPIKSEAWVFLGLRATDSEYEFRVSDNGMGLPAGHAFQAAELLSRAAPVREAGVGVGLSVVKLLVEQSGGTLTVRSEDGRGTDFVLTLPRYDMADFLT